MQKHQTDFCLPIVARKTIAETKRICNGCGKGGILKKTNSQKQPKGTIWVKKPKFRTSNACPRKCTENKVSFLLLLLSSEIWRKEGRAKAKAHVDSCFCLLTYQHTALPLRSTQVARDLHGTVRLGAFPRIELELRPVPHLAYVYISCSSLTSDHILLRAPELFTSCVHCAIVLHGLTRSRYVLVFCCVLSSPFWIIYYVYHGS